MTNTPFERIWDQHVVKEFGDGRALIHIDRHFAQESTSGRAFDGLRAAGLKVRRPELTVGTIDHGLSTLPGRKIDTYAASTVRNLAMRKNCADFGVRLFDIDDPNHGIVHVVGPNLGFALPGCTYVCGDSAHRLLRRRRRLGLGHRHHRGDAGARHANPDHAQTEDAAGEFHRHVAARAVREGHDPRVDRSLRHRGRRRSRRAIRRARRSARCRSRAG